VNRPLQIINERNWERFSSTERIGRSTFYIVTVVAFIWALKKIEVIPEFLYDAPEQTADLFKRMWPFDWKFYPDNIHPALIETFHIATLGTLISLLIAVPLAFLAARNFTSNKTLNWIAQFIFVSTRSVNSLIWALLFVAIFGPGALVGVLSIPFRSIGFVGKLFAEAIVGIRSA
jgi:phosphonate transport system permease protein